MGMSSMRFGAKGKGVSYMTFAKSGGRTSLGIKLQPCVRTAWPRMPGVLVRQDQAWLFCREGLMARA